uniref:Trafficking protein particle complex subunit 13 N-terminal domain-containing protein n=2 Tax=Solanum TaxID=4107 RepID=M1C3A2_SOLTU
MKMSSTQGPHSLAFRVMRLCRPSLHVEIPVRFDPSDLLFGEDLFDDPVAASHLPRLLADTVSATAADGSTTSADPSDLSYRNRFLLQHPSDSLGLPGLLLLPQSFGAIYLGETFCSYISINNSSNFEVRDVTIKAEIQTERQRILLLDTSKSPVESIRAGGRYDFIVEHDVKELGAHTLVCTALYNDNDGERKYLPQYFKFMVANPLSVRTKVRVVKVGWFKLIECKFMIWHSYSHVEILKKMGQENSVFAFSISISLVGMCQLRPICGYIQHTTSDLPLWNICILRPLDIICLYVMSVISTHLGSFLWLKGSCEITFDFNSTNHLDS